MKKMFTVLIALIMLINLLPVSVASAETEYVEVSEYSAAIRNDYYDTSDVLQWVSRGTMLRVLDSKLNWHLNRWFKVEYDTGYSCCIGWIWSGEVNTHQHNYVKYNYNGNTFGVCSKCNSIAIEKVSTVKRGSAEALAATLPAAAGLAAADGPLPVGDIAGVFILVLASLELGQTASNTQMREWVRTASLDEFARSRNACDEFSFYKVQRTNDGRLIKIDNICMNIFQAFVCSRYLGIDVWTPSPDAALICAGMNGRFYGPERDLDQVDYYYHFHYGKDKQNKEAKTHVFFGPTDSGLVPTSF